MYTLKSIARRGTLLGAAFALLASTLLPALPVYADALNPLTDRSLTLSSAAPGWDNKDGSGNTTYAVPNSGANGRKTGNTFDFKVSSDTTTGDGIEAMTFQYCTTPAGNCVAPGNNDYTGVGPYTRVDNGEVAGSWNDFKSDLNVATSSPTEATFSSFVSDVDSATNPEGIVSSIPAANASGSNFMVYYLDGTSGDWTADPGWSMAAVNNESGSETTGSVDGFTGANNEIQLTKADNDGSGYPAGTRVKVVFFATDANYITNPGAEEFFVRINMYGVHTAWDADDIIDGGVTVANVMNQSIQITTKVLETMDFSVGTVDPYTLDSTGGAGSQLATASGINSHGVCDPIVKSLNKTASDADPLLANTLQMGDPNGEFSLATNVTYSTHSYWRLSSNSSGGATVYYSGVTLSNTVGDKIDAIGGTKDDPTPGTEQFGIALDNGTTPDWLVSYAKERDNSYVFQNGDDNAVTGIHATVATDIGANPSYHAPGLYSMQPLPNYDDGTGVINTKDSHYGAATTSQFAFDETSNTIPVPLAVTEDVDGEVVDCVTGKVRYIANIASTTPAGIYTTKINYIASPKY